LAIRPDLTYPTQVNTTDPTGYPYGRAKNVGAIGDGTGTPLEETWVSDLFGWQQALLKAAGITPTNNPDKVGASQYLDAIRSISRRELQKTQALNWPERSSYKPTLGTGGSTSPVGLGYAPDLGVGGGGLWVSQDTANNIATSEDGILWTDRGANSACSFTNPWIAYGKINGASGFLMSQNGNPAVYITSTDGITWSTISTAAVPANPVSAWSQSLGLWVMAGNAGAISTSPTALANTWTARTTPAGWVSGSGGAKRIVWNGSLFVVLPTAFPGGYTKCLSSPDGVNWTERNLGTNQIWVGLAYSAIEGLWMAVADSGAVVKSVDGLTWTIVTNMPGTGAPGYGVKDLAVLGSLWVAPTRFAANGGITYSTDAGATWASVAVGNHRVATQGWTRILAGDDRFAVAHCDGGALEFAFSQRAIP
jgi:hypothetical protein